MGNKKINIKILLIILIFIVIGALLFMSYFEYGKENIDPETGIPINKSAIKLPECIDGLDNDGDGLIDFGSINTNDPDCSSGSDRWERDFSKLFWILGIIVAIIITGCGMYYYFTHRSNSKEDDFFKEVVGADRGWILARSNFIDKYIEDILCKPLSDKEDYISIPVDKFSIWELDRLPRHDPKTGEQFQFSFFRVEKGRMIGEHVLIYSLSRGEENIVKGVSRFECNTSRDTWKLLSRNFPMSSIQDKQDRVAMYLGEQLGDDEVKKMMMGNMNQHQSTGSELSDLDEDDFAEAIRMRQTASNVRRKPKKGNQNATIQPVPVSHTGGEQDE
jgi:hypothetical protein